MTQTDDHVLKAWELAPAGTTIQFTPDGDVVEMASMRTLSISQKLEYERIYLARHTLRLRALKTRLSRAEQKHYETLLDRLAKLVLPSLTDEQHRALTDFDKDTAVAVFTGASEDLMLKMGEATERAMGNLQEPENEDLEEILAS